MNRNETIKEIESNLENVDIAKSIAKDFNRNTSMELFFTSRQVEGFRILDDVIDKSSSITDEEQRELLDELVQIKYVIEQGMFTLKNDISKTLKEFDIQ